MKLSHKLSLLLALILLLMASAINLAIYTNKYTETKVDYSLNTAVPATMAILSLDTHISYAKHYLRQYVRSTDTSSKKIYTFQLREISKQISHIIAVNKDIFEDGLYKNQWAIFSDALTTLINSQNQALKKHNSNNNALVYLDTYYAKYYVDFVDALINMRTYVINNMTANNLTLQNDLVQSKNILLMIFYLSIFVCIILSIFIFKLFTDSAHMTTKEMERMSQDIYNNKFESCRKMAQEHANPFIENILNKLAEIINTADQELKIKQETINNAVQSINILTLQKDASQDKTSQMSDMATALQNLITNFSLTAHNLAAQIESARDDTKDYIHKMKQYSIDFDELDAGKPNITQYVRIVTDFSLYSDNIVKDIKGETQQTIKNIKHAQDNSKDLVADMNTLQLLARSLKKLIKPLAKPVTKKQRPYSNKADKKTVRDNTHIEGTVLPQASPDKTKSLINEVTDIIINMEKIIKKNIQCTSKSLKSIEVSKKCATQSAKATQAIQGAILDTKDKLKGSTDFIKTHAAKSTLLKVSLGQLNTCTSANFDNISTIDNVMADINTQSVKIEQNIHQLIIVKNTISPF